MGLRLKNLQFKSLKIPKKYLILAILLPFLYLVFVLSFVWWHCYFSQFTGGKNGPLDAYRHTLASAVVAYTSSPKVVSLVTVVMERKGQQANLMDKHNNAIGAKIDKNATTFNALKPAVMLSISQGAINATQATQITWLPQQYWGESLFW